MAGKNDKWSMFKNYLHNELGITKEDIRDWIDEAVRDEARKLVQQSFKQYSLRARIDDAVKDINRWGETNLKSAISKEVANRIFEKLEIKVKQYYELHITNMHYQRAVKAIACFGIEKGNRGYLFKTRQYYNAHTRKLLCLSQP